MFKSDKLGVVKCLTASPPLHTLSGIKNRLGLNNRQNIRIYCKNILLFCKWEYSGESTWEAAYSLGSQGLQILKVSNIWALPMMALPCNGVNWTYYQVLVCAIWLWIDRVLGIFECCSACFVKKLVRLRISIFWSVLNFRTSADTLSSTVFNKESDGLIRFSVYSIIM